MARKFRVPDKEDFDEIISELRDELLIASVHCADILRRMDYVMAQLKFMELPTDTTDTEEEDLFDND